jgi:hypothetical protein
VGALYWKWSASNKVYFNFGFRNKKNLDKMEIDNLEEKIKIDKKQKKKKYFGKNQLKI